MTILQDFDYFKPADPREVIRIMEEYGATAHCLAGGTDLTVNLKENAMTASAVIDLKGLPGFQRLDFNGTHLTIGAGVTFNQLLESPVIATHFPIIAESAGNVASHGLRNRATMVGNICSAVPCMDSAAFLLLYDAEIHLQNSSGERIMPISEWFVAPRRTAIGFPEFVTHVTLAKPAARHAGCYVKLKRFRGEDLAQAGVGVLVFENRNYRVAFASVGPVPTRGAQIEAALNGKSLSRELLEQVKGLVETETSPISDVRATRRYRLHMTGIMLERGLQAAQARLAGSGPAYGAPLLG